MAGDATSVLFTPLRVGPLDVAGRVWKSATSETRADEDGAVTDSLLGFYEPIAAAKTPVIITGNLHVSEQGKSTRWQAGAHADAMIPGLSRLASLAHEHGVRLIGQLNHCGRQTLPRAMGRAEAVSASDVREKLLGTKPRPLRIAEIQEVVQHFADAAERCMRAGFDGVQIHAGHGYLIHQFLTPYTNRREDAYGGDRGGRIRLLREVIRAVRARVDGAGAVILKLGGHDALYGRAGLDTEALVHIAVEAEAEGADAIEITVGHYESGPLMVRGRFGPFFEGLIDEGVGRALPWPRRLLLRAVRRPLAWAGERVWPYREGFNLPYADAFRRRLSIPVVCVGGFRTKTAMEAAIAAGSCDAVSVARAMIADPLLHRHLQEGVEGPRCELCNGCIARAGSMPIDCYSAPIRAQKDEMLAAAGFGVRFAASPGTMRQRARPGPSRPGPSRPGS